jgi:hypothetical protein
MTDTQLDRWLFLESFDDIILDARRTLRGRILHWLWATFFYAQLVKYNDLRPEPLGPAPLTDEEWTDYDDE